MAYHGARGASRGGPRGVSRGGFSSGSRGRGRGGGTGSSRGQSRGRGRGGFGRGRGKPIFDSARLAQQKEETEDAESASDDSPEENVEEDLESGSSSEEDEEEPQSVNSYAALMQCLVQDSGSQAAKRRKLDHPSKLEANNKEDNDVKNVDDVADIDHVDEPEEGPETAIEVDDDEPEDSSDPFEVHFADPDHNVLQERLSCLQRNQWSSQKAVLKTGAKAVLSCPQQAEVKPSMPNPITNLGGLKLKQKLLGPLSKQMSTLDAVESFLAPFLFGYQDMLYCERSPANSKSLRRLTCLHAINHIFKTRDRVIKNNARLAKEESSDDLDLRDQGFTRPKVLMVLPTRESCVRMVDMIVSICEPEQQENRKRFDDSYVDKEEKFSSDKPEDFRETFAGNDDDMFRLGLKFTRKTIKYFSQFYNSDIILTSPLGLRMAIEGTEEKKGDHDFLSSIEVVIVDQADSLLMQNWEHVEHVFEHLNLQPKEAHGCDFSRVRNWYLDNNARFFRQTITLTAYNTPEINTLLYNRSQNWTGRVKINGAYYGAIRELDLKIKQTFSRLESQSLVSDPDARFTYFTTAIIPALTRRPKDSAGTVIVIPSYLDFVRVRNYFATSPATSSLSFGCISEYTSVRDVARARSHFFNSRHSILLYTERAHHFRRYQLRGVRKIIMYGLPDNPIFYKEIVGGYLERSLHEGNLAPGEGNVRVIFSESDVLKLERVAGTERVRKMILEKGDTFDFFN